MSWKYSKGILILWRLNHLFSSANELLHGNTVCSKQWLWYWIIKTHGKTTPCAVSDDTIISLLDFVFQESHDHDDICVFGVSWIKQYNGGKRSPWHCLNKKICCLIHMGIPTLKVRWSLDHIIFIEIPIPKGWSLYWGGALICDPLCRYSQSHYCRKLDFLICPWSNMAARWWRLANMGNIWEKIEILLNRSLRWICCHQQCITNYQVDKVVGLSR